MMDSGRLLTFSAGLLFWCPGKGNVFKSFPRLCQAIGTELKAREAVLDGEIVCLDSEGRSQFTPLFYRRGDPCFYAFDLLWLNGRDLHSLPLIERKKALRRIVPKQPARVLDCGHIEEQGEELFRLACERDLEGIVAKRKQGVYTSNPEETTWIKIKNRAYSQLQGRREQFEQKRIRVARTSG